MRNWLVIHNDNIPKSLLKDFKEGQQDVLEFDITPALQINENFSFDYETSEILKNHFSNKKKYTCIFIPYNLNKELYLDFSGLKVALHIRLSPELEHTFCPIVFYGYEDPIHVAKLSPYSKILFSIGSLTLTSSKISFENFNLTCDYLKEMTHEDYVNFLNELNIIPADDYKSYHSTANELALFQWSSFIGCDDQIDEVKVNRNRLYFKYLEAKRLFNADVGWGREIDNNNSGFSQIKINGKIKDRENKEGKIIYRIAKVLLIDDEAKKGWDSFYANLFKINPVVEERVKFESLNPKDENGKEIKFKNLDRVQIIELAKNKVEEFDPDIVLLDLRLQDNDFNQDVSPSDLTGIQIAQKIHLINKGIQVIITSASNKIPNYLASSKQGLGVDGYIIKSTDTNPEKQIGIIVKSISDLIPKADFLKKIFSLTEEIKVLLDNTDQSFKINSINDLEIAFRLIYEGVKEEKYMNFGFLQLFQIIESYLKSPNVFLLNDKFGFVYREKQQLIVLKKNKELSKDDYDYFDHEFDNRFTWMLDLKTNKYKKNKAHPIVIAQIAQIVFVYRYNAQKDIIDMWGSLNRARNTKAVHGSNTKKGLISVLEIEEILKLLIYLINPINQESASVIDLMNKFNSGQKKMD